MSKLTRIGAALLVLFSSFGLAQPAAAETNTAERISLLDIVIDVSDTGVVTFTERIVYNFGANQKHGIFRYVPQEDGLPDGSARLYDISLSGIALNGRSVFYESYPENGNLVWQIGDPDTLISGTQIYEIQYSISGALHPFTAAEAPAGNPDGISQGDYEFYWDVVGDGWDIPIDNVFVEVYTPGEVLKSECFAAAGTVCDFTTNTFEASGLDAFEPLTIAMSFPRDSFSVDVKEAIRPPWREEFTKWIPFGLGAAAVIGVFLSLAITQVRGSVRRFKIAEFVRFEVPENLRPAEIAAAMFGKFESRDLTATLLDLATRGYLRLDLEKKNIRITKLREFDGVASWEAVLLKAVFSGADTAMLDSYEPRIEKAVEKVKAQLIAEAEASGRRPANINSKKKLFIVTAVVSGLLIIPAVIGAAVPMLAAFAWPVLVVGLGLSLVGIFTTPQVHTERSAEFFGAARGFRRALDTDAAKDRREYAQKSGIDSVNIFATFLPFAVIFSLEKAWLASHPEISAAAVATYGIYVADFHDFNDRIGDLTSSISGSMTNPSSSGGGSAGGGGGGGGGGSW